MTFREIWVRAVAIMLLLFGVGFGIGAAAQHDEWKAVAAGLVVLAGVGFAVLSLHERER